MRASSFSQRAIPSVGWQDNPVVGVGINDTWMSITLAALEYLDGDGYWSGTDDEQLGARRNARAIAVYLVTGSAGMVNLEQRIATGGNETYPGTGWQELLADELTINLTTTGKPLVVLLTSRFFCSVANAQANLNVYIDGDLYLTPVGYPNSPVISSAPSSATSANLVEPVSMMLVVTGLAAGAHTIIPAWSCTASWVAAATQFSPTVFTVYEL